jgi:hypothetical protein
LSDDRNADTIKTGVSIMKTKSFHLLDKITKSFEITIAILLLTVIAVKVLEVILDLSGLQVVIISTDFDRILSTAFALVIGVEFTKMLCKLNTETVIDVLLFAIARQTVIYHEGSLDLLIGVFAIAGLFAIKRYLINYAEIKKDDSIEVTHDKMRKN